MENENLKIDDFEILKEIIDGKSDIKNLDVDTKKRLIELCSNRLDDINKKIHNKTLEIKRLKEILYN